MTTKTTSAATSPGGAKDAITLLKADHATVSELFSDDEKLCSDAKADACCRDLYRVECVCTD